MSITLDGFKREKVDIVTMVYVREIVRDHCCIMFEVWLTS